MQKILILTIIFNIPLVMFSQFSVSIVSQTGKPCVDSEIEFVAKVTNAGVAVKEDVTYTWSFGDGSTSQTGLNLDTIVHKFKKGGGYIIRLDVRKDAESSYDLKQFNIALKPIFEGTQTDREKPICLGQQIFLTGKVKEQQWEFKPKTQITESEPIVISESKNYTAEYDYRFYRKSAKIVDGSEIDTIGIKLEYSDISHIKIELIAPNGTELLLKDFGGTAGKFFGEPNLSAAGKIGKPYYYFWTNSPDNGKMNETTTTGKSLPAGSYQADEAFNKLTGCLLNGVWKIKITDNNTAGSGFVAETKLVIKGQYFFDNWSYKHTYSHPEWIGNNVSSTSDIGLATAIPNAYGNHKYTYKIEDDFGCIQDTSVVNNVEAASFVTTPDSASGPFDLTVSFENKTSWAKQFEWDFGDKSQISTDEKPEHIYTINGKFKALFTAKTEDGCSDTMSIIVRVTIPKSSLDEIPNAFTPNNDGVNDVFKLNKGTAIKKLDAVIYSRWGKKIHEWHSVEEASEKGWDGNVEGGAKASPGVYYYVIKAEGFDGKVYNKNGAFHLFR